MGHGATWTAEPTTAVQDADAGADEYVSRLAESGALDEAEHIFDELDAGVNPCDGESLNDVVRRSREIIANKRS